MLPTTAAVLEILIIGFEALAWIVLFCMAILPPRVHIRTVADSPVLTVAVVGLFAYALGVVVDRFADTVYKWLRDETKVLRWVGKPPRGRILPSFSIMRLRIMTMDDGRARFLEYQRSRLRIARSTVFNLPLLLAATTWYLVARTDLGPWSVVGIDLLIVALLALSVVATERIGDAYYGRLVDSYRMWQNENEGPAREERKVFGERISRPCRRYAAVPYRIGDGRDRPALEFLVVRTSKGHHWTFPKGNKDSKKKRRVNYEKGSGRKWRREKGWEAALREAKEEAGVTGEIRRDSFHRYPFPASDDEKCTEHLVKAYLLPFGGKVKRRGEDAEREVRWDTPERVADLLAEGRKAKYAKAHRAVVDAAVKELETSTDIAG